MPTLVKCQGELDYQFVDMSANHFFDADTITSSVTLIWDWGLVDSGLCIDTDLTGIQIQTQTGNVLFGDLVNVILKTIEICAGVGSPYVIRIDAQNWSVYLEDTRAWSITEDPEQVWNLNNRRCGK